MRRTVRVSVTTTRRVRGAEGISPAYDAESVAPAFADRIRALLERRLRDAVRVKHVNRGGSQ